jgi:hypothetical protein
MTNLSNRIVASRVSDAHEGDIVVFLIGMRINRFLRPDKWLPVARAMPAMLKELEQKPELGLLGWQRLMDFPRAVVLLQYWRDFDRLHAYAHDRTLVHLPAWQAFNRAAKGNDAVGVFHETYVVPAGAHESIYVDMPPFGLGKVAGLVPSTGNRSAARDRLRAVGWSPSRISAPDKSQRHATERAEARCFTAPK